MSQTKCSDIFPNPKESEENDIDCGPSRKIPKLDESEKSEGGSKSEFKEIRTLKQPSSKKNFAKKYLLKHGYKEGSGLGKYENGIIQPIEASKQRGRRGLGFEPVDLKDAVFKYDPNLEEVSLDEEVLWLINDHSDTINSKCLESWIKVGISKKCIDDNSQFCEPAIINSILTSKNVFSTITVKELKNGRRRSNPFESIHNAIFLNRAAMKMANLDAILDRMFTDPKNMNGERVVGSNELLYFADVCAGPGGFSEYVLFRKKWRAKGFGFTLRDQNDFLLDQFWAGPSESFEPHYGEFGDGNVFKPENITSFKKHVLKYTDGEGVHFMMADGGVRIDEKLNDQELICKKLYLCQCLVALHIVRTGGHFVVKLFDLFTEFSVGLVYLMYRSFRQISIIKPNTSRPANSERYLVCKWKREDSKDIADHLFEINKRIPEFKEKQEVTTEEDILELVPINILVDDNKFYNYITSSNNRLGEKQIVSLLKLAAFSEKVNLIEERQQELRKASLKKWNIPDEARAEPKKWDPRAKWTELLGNSSICDLDCDAKKNTICSYEFFKQNIVSKYSWYCVVLSGEESNGTCAFYLGLGRNNVHKYGSGKWTKLSCSGLCFPMNTLVYGELVQEYLGTGKGQRKIFAFHIIDGLFLGNEDIRHLSFTARLNMCRLFAKSLYKETCPVRVKNHYSLADIDLLWENLVLKSIKSSSFRTSLCIPLEAESFFKAGGIMFIRDTKDSWNRFNSTRTNAMFFHNREENKSLFEKEVENEHSKNIYADFEHCFRSRLIWWWDEGVVVHESQKFPPDPRKLQKENISYLLRCTDASEIICFASGRSPLLGAITAPPETHTLMECPAWAEERTRLVGAIGADLSLPAVVRDIIAGEILGVVLLLLPASNATEGGHGAAPRARREPRWTARPGPPKSGLNLGPRAT